MNICERLSHLCFQEGVWTDFSESYQSKWSVNYLCVCVCQTDRQCPVAWLIVVINSSCFLYFSVVYNWFKFIDALLHVKRLIGVNEIQQTQMLHVWLLWKSSGANLKRIPPCKWFYFKNSPTKASLEMSSLKIVRNIKKCRNYQCFRKFLHSSDHSSDLLSMA